MCYLNPPNVDTAGADQWLSGGRSQEMNANTTNAVYAHKQHTNSKRILQKMVFIYTSEHFNVLFKRMFYWSINPKGIVQAI